MVSQQRQRLLERQSAQQLKTSFAKQQIIKQERKQIEEQQKTSKLNVELEEVKNKLDEGKISSIEQIKPELRQYINIPEGYFENVKTYQQQLAEYNAYKTVEKFADKGKVWLLAMYGDGLEKKIAKKWLKLGGEKTIKKVQQPTSGLYKFEVIKKDAPTPITPKINVGSPLFKPSEVSLVKPDVEYKIVGKGQDILTYDKKSGSAVIKTINIETPISDLIPKGSVKDEGITSEATTEAVNPRTPNIIQEKTLIGEWTGVTSPYGIGGSQIGITYPKGQEPIISPNIQRSVGDIFSGTLDFLSAGSISEQRLGEKQQELNADVEEFNVKYGNKELTQEEYSKASSEIEKLNKRQEEIDTEKQEIIESPLYQAGAFAFGTFGRGELNPMLDITGEPIRVYADTIPLSPATSTLNRIKDIQFLGTQKIGEGGDILTDLTFVVDSKRVGIASALSRRGEDDLIRSIVGGTSGELGVSFPTATTKIGKIQSFVGKATSKQSEISAKVSSIFNADDVLLNIQNLDDIALTKNIGVAESVATKGSKLIRTGIKFPTGEIISKPATLTKDLSLVKSLASQEDDLIKVVGSSKSLSGGGTIFEGIIKQLVSKADKLDDLGFSAGSSNTFTKVQEKALLDTISGVASGVSKFQKNILEPISSIVASEPIITKTIVRERTIVKQKPVQLSNLDIQLNKVLSREAIIPAVRSEVKSVSKTKSKSSQTQKLDVGLVEIQEQTPKQAQKLAQRVSQLNQMTELTFTPFTPFPTLAQDLSFRGLNIKRKQKQLPKKKLKQEAYNVYVKVPKKKSYSKITKKPVSRRDAENLRAFAIDESTSRQGYIKRVKTKPSKLNYDIPPTYSRDNDFKFRKFKQKKGKKIPLINRVIEKSKYMQDTRNEKKDLSVFRTLARVEKKKLNKINKPFGLGFA